MGERSVTRHSTVPLAHRQYIRQANEARSLFIAGAHRRWRGFRQFRDRVCAPRFFPRRAKEKRARDVARQCANGSQQRQEPGGETPPALAFTHTPSFSGAERLETAVLGLPCLVEGGRGPRKPAGKKKKEKVRKQPAKCTSIYATVKLKEKGGGGRKYISFFVLFFRSPIIKLKLWCGAVFTHPRIYTPPIYTHTPIPIKLARNKALKDGNGKTESLK